MDLHHLIPCAAMLILAGCIDERMEPMADVDWTAARLAQVAARDHGVAPEPPAAAPAARPLGPDAVPAWSVVGGVIRIGQMAPGGADRPAIERRVVIDADMVEADGGAHRLAGFRLLGVAGGTTWHPTIVVDAAIDGRGRTTPFAGWAIGADDNAGAGAVTAGTKVRIVRSGR